MPRAESPFRERIVRGHFADVAVVAPRGSIGGSGFVSDARVNEIVAGVANFWTTQSNGQVTSLTRDTPIRRFTSAYSCSQTMEIWSAMAAEFGQRAVDYVSRDSRHLIVLVPKGCGSVGLGTVGVVPGETSAGNGGLVWATLDGITDVDTVAHELGHNLGLNHSNVHYCHDAMTSEGRLIAPPSTFAPGCVDVEYDDSYDIMGGGIIVNGKGNTQPPALNVTHKQLLDAVASDELRSVNQTTTVTLNSTGTSGLRALSIIDPRTGQRYFVDFRGGAGTDAAALYASGALDFWGAGKGVRVLTMRSDQSSVVLSRPGDGPLVSVAGESWESQSRGLKVRVDSTTATTATLTVTLDSFTSRVSGVDRYSTALAIAEAGYPSTAPIVYVATGVNFPDALAAAPAAAVKGGPLLLTLPEQLPATVAAKIKRLAPAKIVVVGGPNAVSNTVLAQLKAIQSNTVRLSGVDRFATARAIVEDAFPRSTDAYIATGRNYPDALAAAAAAGAQARPVVLVDGNAPAIDPSSLALLRKLGVVRATVVGGTSVVSSGMQASLTNSGVAVTRRGGVDRFQTAQLVNESAFATTGATEAFFATGYQFPDALAGAALAGARKAPLYLVPATCVPSAAANGMTKLGVVGATLLGGVNALGDGVAMMKLC